MYKRQVQGFVKRETETVRVVEIKIRTHVYTIEPVSYTHLDVYKRQVHTLNAKLIRAVLQIIFSNKIKE